MPRTGASTMVKLRTFHSHGLSCVLLMDTISPHYLPPPLRTPWTVQSEHLRKWFAQTDSDYIGFWGGVLYPPKEADINRLCSQFSLYWNLFNLSAGLCKPLCIWIVRGLEEAKFWISAHPLMLSSAAAFVPWKYWVLKRCLSILCINRSSILLVRCALGWS